MRENLYSKLALTRQLIIAGSGRRGIHPIELDNGEVRFSGIGGHYDEMQHCDLDMTFKPGLGMKYELSLYVNETRGAASFDPQTAAQQFVDRMVWLKQNNARLSAERLAVRAAVEAVIKDAAAQGIEMELLSLKAIQLTVDRPVEGRQVYFDVELRAPHRDHGCELTFDSFTIDAPDPASIDRYLRDRLLPELRALIADATSDPVSASAGGSMHG